MNAQSPLFDQSRQQRRTLRRRTMMMAFPPGPEMTHELALVTLAGLAPEPGDMHAHGIQRRLPVDALLPGRLALRTQGPQQLQRTAQ
ncbi:hypothetical protein D3C84_1160930 [compost metagenome]